MQSNANSRCNEPERMKCEEKETPPMAADAFPYIVYLQASKFADRQKSPSLQQAELNSVLAPQVQADWHKAGRYNLRLSACFTPKPMALHLPDI